MPTISEQDLDSIVNMWDRKVAVSSLQKCLQVSDIERAAYSYAWLATHQGRQGASAGWRRLMGFCASDLSGIGIERVMAHYLAWKEGYDHANAMAAILYLSEIVSGATTVPDKEPGKLLRWAGELKDAAFFWVQGARPMEPPDAAFDHYAGFGSVEETVERVNSLGPPSPWRDDASRGVISKYKQRELIEKIEEDAKGGVSFA